MLEKPKKKKKQRIVVLDETYKAVFERDKGCCVLCGNSYGIQLHHIVSRLGDNINDINNCCMLCQNCHHNVVHRNLKKYRPILKEYIDTL